MLARSINSITTRVFGFREGISLLLADDSVIGLDKPKSWSMYFWCGVCGSVPFLENPRFYKFFLSSLLKAVSGYAIKCLVSLKLSFT